MVSSSNLFELKQIEIENTNVDATRIFEEMHKEIGYYLILEGNHLQEGFDELIGEDIDKKRFVKRFTRIFALLLNTKVDTADKIKRILEITIETTLKIWQGPK